MNSNEHFASQGIEDKYEELFHSGTVNFAATGNDGVNTISYPASIDFVNGIGALGPAGVITPWSNTGPGIFGVAPGIFIWTTDRTGPDGEAPGDSILHAGTSFACPYAAGVAALIMTETTNQLDFLTFWGATYVGDILASTATDLGPSGYDETYGWGLVNARRALEQVGDRYVEAGWAGSQLGLYSMPYDNVTDGVNSIQPGETLVIRAGSYNETITLSKEMWIRTPTGTVTIGE